MGKHQKHQPDHLNHKYNGDAYKKPRYMKPKNMDKDSVDSFNEGHVAKGKKPSKPKKK